MQGLFDKAIVTIYEEPKFTKNTVKGIESTISDEGLYGMSCTLISEDSVDGFWHIRTHYNYEGYVQEEDVLFVSDEDYEDRLSDELYWVIKGFADVLTIPSVQGNQIISLTRGAIIRKVKDAENGYSLVALNDGTCGYIKESYILPYVAPMTVEELKSLILKGDITENDFREAVVATAKLYMGTQYRWGGKSTLGIDCSGLTSMSYMLNGILTYRDAKIVEGFPVHKINQEDLKPGDLIYFPGHIAMYIGKGEYIHSTAKTGSDGVVINSLHPGTYNYREDLPGKILYCGSIF